MITTPPEAVARLFAAAGLPNFPPRYNVAPTQSVPVVRRSGAGARELAMMRWGLVPGHWSRGARGKPMINARSETAARLDPFRRAFAQRRCLVPANGYYEWEKRRDGRQPFLFRPRDGSLFAMAGLWEEARDDAFGPPLVSCTILTTTPSDLVRPLHDRMPVILAPAAWPAWLGETAADAAELAQLLRPGGDEDFACVAVSRRVNAVANDDAACIEPVATKPGGEGNDVAD
ncbi:MAG: SOS response-associated peptidase [Proteobacteria bacterium]|nr:SOS response-associated peptidase [Pseudomonadota bacterium]MDA1132616.1 SOS response-associated peptidase [Pseudomonadota bacterium]